jgi:hypothetical protein
MDFITGDIFVATDSAKVADTANKMKDKPPTKG